jgi:ADP-L-glycero-D-manno-heptose 6-epimerase
MIVITGGAGFIGSALVWRLNQNGIDDILVVDHLGVSDKWTNLVPLRFGDYIDKSDFLPKLESGAFGSGITALFHIGACSSTTEQDAGYLMENNYRYTDRIAHWWERNQSCRFVYASSAATYGDGTAGYSDSHDAIYKLCPLNMYGYSKHLFDLQALRRGWLDKIVGLKFFNVYGPNEWHKGEMRSVVNKAYSGVRDHGRMTLFSSHRDGYADGEQRRDFLYVKDAVDMALFFMDHREANGIFNIGSGTARSWNDVASALFSAADKPVSVDYVPMPVEIRDRYQYYTCADMAKLRIAGCHHKCMSLEDGVRDYVQSYLSGGLRLGSIV